MILSRHPQLIHLGYRLGVRHLCAQLKALREIGIHHVALNLRFNRADIETTMRRIADDGNLRHDLERKGLINVDRFTWERTASSVLQTLKRAAS